jgi:hypothetical protein
MLVGKMKMKQRQRQELEDRLRPFYHPIAKPRSLRNLKTGLGRYDSVDASPDYSGSMHSVLQGASRMVRSIWTADGQTGGHACSRRLVRHPCRSCETAVVRDTSCVSGSRSDLHHEPCRRAAGSCSAVRAGREAMVRRFANAVAVIRRLIDL